jgi:hypothetical protein
MSDRPGYLNDRPARIPLQVAGSEIAGYLKIDMAAPQWRALESLECVTGKIQ